jgi:hypothetical protein
VRASTCPNLGSTRHRWLTNRAFALLPLVVRQQDAQQSDHGSAPYLVVGVGGESPKPSPLRLDARPLCRAALPTRVRKLRPSVDPVGAPPLVVGEQDGRSSASSCGGSSSDASMTARSSSVTLTRAVTLPLTAVHQRPDVTPVGQSKITSKRTSNMSASKPTPMYMDPSRFDYASTTGAVHNGVRQKAAAMSATSVELTRNSAATPGRRGDFPPRDRFGRPTLRPCRTFRGGALVRAVRQRACASRPRFPSGISIVRRAATVRVRQNAREALSCFAV